MRPMRAIVGVGGHRYAIPAPGFVFTDDLMPSSPILAINAQKVFDPSARRIVEVPSLPAVDCRKEPALRIRPFGENRGHPV